MASDVRPAAPSARGLAGDRVSLWWILGSLAALQFGYPITDVAPAWAIVYLLLYGAVIVVGVRRTSGNRKRFWPIFIGAVALVAGGTWFAFQQDSDAATAAMLGGTGLLQLALLTSLVGNLLSPPPRARGTDLLLVAVSCYLLIGGVFGMVSGLIEIAAPGSFIDNSTSAPLTWQALLYTSFVTLATLGFGDIVPVTLWARSLLSLEAVVSTLFVAVVISRLVSAAGNDNE